MYVLMAKEKILLLGGGGHCKSVIEAIESGDQFEIAGILDSADKVGQSTLGYPVLGTDDKLVELLPQIPNVIVTVGQLKNANKRLQLYEFAKNAGAQFPIIVASTAYVSRHATVGEGTVILHHAFVNAGAHIGSNVIINTAALIEHNATIGNHTHISTGAIINGNCEVGSQVFFGSNAVLKQGIKVTDNSIVGAGAVVVKEVSQAAVLLGNPAKKYS